MSNHLPEVPRYLVSRSAMFAWRENGMLTDQIGMVTYADHARAMLNAELTHEREWLEGTAKAREQALREALAAVRVECYHDDPDEWCIFADAIQRLIDGPDMTPSDEGEK